MPWDYIEELGGQTPDTITVTYTRAWLCPQCQSECEVGAELCGDCIAENIPEVRMSDSEIVSGGRSMFEEACQIVRASTTLFMVEEPW